MTTLSFIFDPLSADLRARSFLKDVRYWRVDILKRAIEYICWFERLKKVLRRDTWKLMMQSAYTTGLFTFRKLQSKFHKLNYELLSQNYKDQNEMITFSLIFELPYQVIDLHVWSFLILVRYWRVDVLRRAIKYIRWLERLIKFLRRDHLEADYAISMYHGAFYL